MFILLVGLLGVAAMIPAGRFEILQGSKIDHATALGRAAFRDLKIRGYLNPGPRVAGQYNWVDAGGTSQVWDFSNPLEPFVDTNASPVTRFPALAVAIDPLGAVAGYTRAFPFGVASPNLRMVRIYPTTTMPTTPQLADLVFRNTDDLLFEPNQQNDQLPPSQLMFGTNAKRASQGDYSWMATIVPDGAIGDAAPADGIVDVVWLDGDNDGVADDFDGDGTPDLQLPNDAALAGRVTVSVIIFYKRDLSIAGNGEATAPVNAIVGGGIGGGDMQLNLATAINKFEKGLKPGQWIMLAGRQIHTVNGPGGGGAPLPPAERRYFRWYRVVAADEVDTSGPTQNVTLAGPDWNFLPANTTAWLIDNVIAVYEKNMRLEIE